MPHSVTRSAVFTVMEPGSARSTRAGGVTEIRTTTSAAAGGMGDPLRDASRSERHRERNNLNKREAFNKFGGVLSKTFTSEDSFRFRFVSASSSLTSVPTRP